MMKRVIALVLTFLSILSLTACGSSESSAGSGYDGDTIVLRICNWEEYIDEGGWDPEEETIDLESGDIIGDVYPSIFCYICPLEHAPDRRDRIQHYTAHCDKPEVYHNRCDPLLIHGFCNSAPFGQCRRQYA